MFFDYNHPSIEYTGRFADFDGKKQTVLCGSVIKIAFKGDYILLNFDTSENESPMPHVYLSLDGGAKVEAALDKFLRVEATYGEHQLSVIFKSKKSIQERFKTPTVGKMAFIGYYAENSAALLPDERRTVEIIGDSITEGQLVDSDLIVTPEDDQNMYPYQNDATASYAWLTAKALGLRLIQVGHGGAAVTRTAVKLPRAIDFYDFCFEHAPVAYKSPDYVIINYGANDVKSEAKDFVDAYRELLTKIRKKHQSATIIVLAPFVGAFSEELSMLVSSFNENNADTVSFIDTSGWIAKEPLHPLRETHKIIAERLVAELKNII